MNSDIVQVSDVNLIYHEPHVETLALENLNFTIEKGEFVSIVGPSGCGKTSVLSLLAGIMQPSSGTVEIMGRSVVSPTQNVGYMLQHDHLLDWRTIEGNIYLGLQVKKILNTETKDYALSLLDRYGLMPFRYHYPAQLSGGMRQKVALIRTLAFSPDLLLLDEPFSALDYQTRLKVADEVHGIIRNENKTAILVTHDISEAISMSDRILVFSQRPARVKAIHTLSFSGDSTSLKRRNEAAFKDYFDQIWKELDINEE